MPKLEPSSKKTGGKNIDKDLAAAMMLERCSCYDKALGAAKKVLEKGSPDSEDSFMARKIIKSLGEEFLKQRFMERSMPRYRRCPGL